MAIKVLKKKKLFSISLRQSFILTSISNDTSTDLYYGVFVLAQMKRKLHKGHTRAKNSMPGIECNMNRN